MESGAMGSESALSALSARLMDGRLAPYERSDVADEVFELWLTVAAEFTQGTPVTCLPPPLSLSLIRCGRARAFGGRQR